MPGSTGTLGVRTRTTYSTLTVAERRRIISAARAGVGVVDIARRFGISAGSVRDILEGKEG